MFSEQLLPTYHFVFDLDGTLIDTDTANNRAYQQALSDIIHQEVDYHGLRLTRETIQLTYNIDGYTMQNIIAEKERLFPEYLDLTFELPGYYLLRHLKAPSIILLTNARRKRAELLLSYYNLHSSFNSVYYREDYAGASKFHYLIRSVGFSPTDVILFENESSMVQEAIRLGVPAKNIFKT